MENQPAKRREKFDGDGSDRITQLPEPILHHILCFLSQKKAVQTCVLSKSWRHLGPNRPVIDLCRTCGECYKANFEEIRSCENCFSGNKEAFASVLDDTFQRYHDRNIFTREICLQMWKVEVNSHSFSVLKKWIPMFIKPNTQVTSFRLLIDVYSWVRFDLPSVVFQAESLRELFLHGCRLNKRNLIDNNNNNVVLLKSLQTLSLRHVCIDDDETLEKIMAGCPLLEYAIVTNCKGLKAIKIANKNHYLKRFEFSWCPEEKSNEHSIEIDAPTLQSISIRSCSNWIRNHNNYFPHLKSLHLYCVQLSTKSFDNFSCNFPRLEELKLMFCCGLEGITLSSGSLKRLTIQLPSSIKKVAIDAPNLLYFMFFSRCLPTTFSLAPTSRECKSHLYLSDCVYFNDDVLSRLLRLIEMVKALSQSQISLKLYETLYFKTTQTEWSFDGHPIVVEHLGLNISKSCLSSLPHMFNTLFRIFRPRYTNALRVSPNVDEEVNEFLWKTLIHGREKREYGWEQHLVEVSIEASDEKGEVWHHVQWACLQEWSKNQKIRFRLKWSD